MLRVCLTGWAVFVAVWVLLATQAAHAAPTLKAPSEHPEGDCAWTQNGEEVEVDGFTYMCMCELVHQVGEYWCHWQLVASPERVKRVKRRPHAKPRYGISTAVISKRVTA